MDGFSAPPVPDASPAGALIPVNPSTSKLMIAHQSAPGSVQLVVTELPVAGAVPPSRNPAPAPLAPPATRRVGVRLVLFAPPFATNDAMTFPLVFDGTATDGVTLLPVAEAAVPTPVVWSAPANDSDPPVSPPGVPPA